MTKHWIEGVYVIYRKPPNISPGLIFVRKHFWWAYTFFFGGGAYIRVGLYTDKILR